MSSLYEVGVIKRQESKIKISVQVIHPDSNYITDSPGFALMLLYHNVNNDSPIKKEVDFDDTLDEVWMKKNAYAFIKSVDLKMNNPNKKGWKKGVLDITVTHPAWLEHLKDIDHWDSAAFDPTDDYIICEPILPIEEEVISIDNLDLTSKKGFMPIWKYMIPDSLLKTQKDILWFPTLGEKYYKESDRVISDLSDENLQKWEGTLVRTAKSCGILFKRETDWGIISCSRGSMGSSYIDGEMTQMVLNPKKKNGYTSSPKSILIWGRPVVYEILINGDTISFKLMIMSEDNDRIFLETKMSVLKFMLKRFESFSGNEYNIVSPLCEKMNTIMKEKNIKDTHTLYLRHKEIAEQFIVSSRIDKIRDVPYPEFYQLKNEEIMDLYSFEKWPAYEISVKITDAKWLEQYPKEPFSYIFSEYD